MTNLPLETGTHFFETAAAIPIRSKAEGVRRLMVMSVTKQQDDEDIYTGPEIDM